MPSVTLSSKWNNTSGLCVGRYQMVPGAVYSDLDMRDENLVAAIQRGDVIFADATDTAAFKANSLVQAQVKQFNADDGTNL